MTDLKKLTLVFACLAAPAHAQDGSTFVVPSGCEAFLTVQSRECTVAHYWSCAAEAPGSSGGSPSMPTDPTTCHKATISIAGCRGIPCAVTASLVLLSEEDPASLDELFETGRDEMIFTLEQTENGVTFQQTYEGFDAVSGAEVEIDGETLMLTEFAYEYETEAGTRRTSGNQFLSVDRRLFFGGVETTVLPSGEAFEADRSPREFIDPGEAGFLSMIPLYDCGEILSGLPWETEDRG